MLNWAKAHPIWATLIGLVLLFLLYMLFFRSSGGGQSTGAIGVVQPNTTTDPAAAQLQALSIQGQYQTQQAQLAADVESDRNATTLAIATLQAQLQQTTVDQQAAIAAAQIAAQQHTSELQSTLAAQIESSRVQAETQASQLQATIAAQQISSTKEIEAARIASAQAIEAGRNANMLALQQSQAQLSAQIQQSNADIQKQLIASNTTVQTKQIKAASGWCFVTTAYVTLQGKPDDCAELQLAREWRDNWLEFQAGGCDAIALYYECAPRFLKTIENRDDRDAIIRAIGHGYVEPFLRAVRLGQNELAFSRYIAMMEYIGRTYDETILGALDAWHVRRSRLLMAAA